MSYLIDLDFNVRIQPAHLTQITTADPYVMRDAKKIVIEDVKFWLAHKYDLSRELIDTELYDVLKVYTLPARVYSGSDIYYTVLPFPVFDYNKTYLPGASCFWLDRVYTAPNGAAAGGLNPDADPNVWTAAGSASTVAAGLLANTTKWTKADNRSALLVSVMLDLCIYAIFTRVAPNNIPQLRLDRYLAAVEWLKAAGTGAGTVALPYYNPAKGARIRYGSRSEQKNNNY